MVEEALTAQPETGRLDPAFVKLAVILLTGVMVVVFDTTIVNVAIDTLSRSLHAPVSTTQWVVTGYLLALGMVIPVSGWSMQRFGAKQMWLFALALFLVGSVASSTAPDIGALIAFRVVQGIGGGLMLPILQTLLIRAAGGRPLGRVMAMLSLPGLLGPILGPVIGGLIIAHLSWRWIFWVNVPFCVAGLVMAWRGLPASTPGQAPRLDRLGLALLSPGLAAVIYGLSEVGSQGGLGHVDVLVPLAAGVALLALFGRHALATRQQPVVDLRLFRVRSFAASSSLLFLSGMALYGAMLLLPLYYQQVRGQSALAAGLLLAPQGLGMLLTRGQAGKLTDRIGARPVVLAGFVLAVAGTLAYTQAGLHSNEILLSVSLVLRGAGLGAVTIPVMAAAFQGLRPELVPHASSATRIMQQVGGSFGTAVVAMILQTQLTAHAAGAGGRAAAFDVTFWWSLGLTAIAVVPALFLPGRVSPRPRPAADGSVAAGRPADRAYPASHADGQRS
jgi:EmrB/QacA subfamily drug resistance transporter